MTLCIMYICADVANPSICMYVQKLSPYTFVWESKSWRRHRKRHTDRTGLLINGLQFEWNVRDSLTWVKSLLIIEITGYVLLAWSCHSLFGATNVRFALQFIGNRNKFQDSLSAVWNAIEPHFWVKFDELRFEKRQINLLKPTRAGINLRHIIDQHYL